MSTEIHFMDIGQGNMVLIKTESNRIFFFDCNITDDNEDRVLDYVADQIGEGKKIKAFICSHRDADHMRGVRKLHNRFPISAIWDSGYPGTTTDSTEYLSYMSLRRDVGFVVRERQKYEQFGRTRFRFLSAADDRLESNANAQGIVIKVEHRRADDVSALSSAMLTGDSDCQTWTNGILQDYHKSHISADILMAAHHGSDSFFDDPDKKYYYTDHLESIAPDMTVISVGDNSHGHPNESALKFYREHTSGSKKGNKIVRTDTKGTIKLVLKDGGGWSLSWNQ